MTPAARTTEPDILASDQWRSRQAAHSARIDGLLGDRLARRTTRGRQSIEEFLFTYYRYRPAQLRRWQPGPGFLLETATPDEFGPFYVGDGRGAVHLDVPMLLGRRRESVEWICRLLRSTATRQPHFGCFGMHEWAMVYRQTPAETRHNILPLRLGAEATAALVEDITIRCSHFDAFRFFTSAARPLNVLQPTRETQHENDQPACLHANMDVYRWAYKLSPLVPSELIGDCFELARDIRTLDIRASPYDVTAIGLDPVRVELPEGRAEYVRQQRVFSERAGVLRLRLIDYCERALTTPDTACPSAPPVTSLHLPHLPDEVAAATKRLGLRATKVTHRTDKTLLVAGTMAERPVAIKCLLDPDPFWAAKLRHEVQVYRAFADSPPPLRVPRLLYTDNTRLLVLEWLEGRRLDDDRYPQRTLTADTIDLVLCCVDALNRWSAPPGTFKVIFDYPSRFDRYHAEGYLTDQDRDALARLLHRAGQPNQVNHGDPLASNILLTSGTGATLVDWEFAGLFLPGFDLAVLHTQLGAHTPLIKQRIDDLIIAASVEESFTVNLAAVLTRELRIHHELPAGPLRERRLALIEAAWDEARQRLHRLASTSSR